MSNVNTSEAGYYQKAYDDYIRGQEERSKEREAAQARELDRIQDTNKAQRLEQEQDAQRAIDEARKDAADVVSWNRKADSETISNLKEEKKEVYNKYAQLANGKDSASLEHQLKESYAASQDRNEKYDKDLEIMRANQNVRMQEINAEAEDATRALKQSHAEETSELRSKLKDMTRAEKLSEERRAANEAKDIKDRESEWLLKRRILMDSYENQIGKLKGDQDTAERTSQEKQRETIRDKEAYYADLLRKANLDAHTEKQGLENTYRNIFTKQDQQAKLDKERSDAATAARIADLNENRTKSLNDQAAAYQDTITRSQIASKDTITQLEKELHRQRTNDDPSVISPAAEALVRDSMTRHYEKQFDAEKGRNKAALDHAVREYKNHLSDLHYDSEMKRTLASQESAARETQDRNQFLNHTRDTEMMKDITLRGQQQDHDRELDIVSNKYETMIERMRKEYEGIVESQRLNAMDKILTQRQNSDYQQKLAAREFSIRQTEVAREHDKKMNAQRQSYELQIDDLKGEMRKAIAEEQRRNKLNVDELARGYEFRMKQMEQQNEDRERRIAQSYEDEIEKLKRSHALQLQKKG